MRSVLPAADTLDNELIQLLHTMSGEDTVSKNLHSYQVKFVFWKFQPCWMSFHIPALNVLFFGNNFFNFYKSACDPFFPSVSGNYIFYM